MSQMTSAARAGARPLNRPSTSTPRLRVVTGATPRTGAGFGIICLALLAAGLIGLLMLNTALGQGSFTVHDLQATAGELTDTEDVLTQSLEASKSPANLAARAVSMGMVPSQSAAFLRLSDGKVFGVAKPALPAPAFTVMRTTSSSRGPAPALAPAAGTTAKPTTR